MDTIFISKYEESNFDILLIPNRIIKKENLGDRCKYFLIIGCGLKCTINLPIFVETDDGKIPILDKYGNIVYANQLKTRKRYCIGYGNNNNSYNNGQFILYDCLCLPAKSSFSTCKIKTISNKKEEK